MQVCGQLASDKFTGMQLQGGVDRYALNGGGLIENPRALLEAWVLSITNLKVDLHETRLGLPGSEYTLQQAAYSGIFDVR